MSKSWWVAQGQLASDCIPGRGQGLLREERRWGKTAHSHQAGLESQLEGLIGELTARQGAVSHN